MTRNLKLFTLFCLLWSIPFFMTLHWMLFDSSVRGPVMLPATLLYGLGFSLAGKYFGKRDDQSKVRYDLGMRYGLASTLASAIVGALWIIGWRHDHWWELAVYSGIVLINLVVAYIISRKSVKGMPVTKLFK